MSIEKLQITQLRNLSWVDISPSANLNIFFGLNGSGKSSLLEAIYLLAHGRSFRSNNIRNVISRDKKNFIVFSELISNAIKIPIGIERGVGLSRTRIAGKNATSLAELASLLPLQFIGPDLQKAVEGGPKERRTLLDWGVFHVEHSFYRCWLSYKKLLKQRNSALRQRKQHQTITCWDGELVKVGNRLNSYREEYIRLLLPYLDKLLNEMFSLADISCSFNQGWSDERSFDEILKKTLSSDIKKGFTGYGPHRADLIFKYLGCAAVDQLSRGQLKLLVIAFKLAQVQLLQSMRSKCCIILMDDLPAELDVENRSRVLNTLLDSNAQLFVTTTERRLIDCSEITNNKDIKVFHVEHGLVIEVVQ